MYVNPKSLHCVIYLYWNGDINKIDLAMIDDSKKLLVND